MIFRIVAQMNVGRTERQAVYLLETYCVLKACPCQEWSVTVILLSREFIPTAVLHADVCGKTWGAGDLVIAPQTEHNSIERP